MAPTRIIRTVRLEGRVLPGDSAARLLRFLDIHPGAPWGEQLQSRVIRDLETLSYVPDANIDDNGALVISVRPLRMVRHIYVTGNWPLFETEVLSNLTWRPRDRLPDGDLLASELRKQENDLVGFLHRAGYYDATAEITLDWPPAHSEQIDVRVHVHLNSPWRLGYGLGNVDTHGFHLLSHDQVRSIFDHCCLWFGRTNANKINEDVKKLVDEYQKKGYAGVRVVSREVHPDPVRKQVDIALTIEERKRIELTYKGHKQLSKKELDEVVTIRRDNYYSANELDESARQIFQLYQRNGFFEAQVGWRWLDRHGDPLRVEFDIHEGPELRIREVRFEPAPGQPPLHYKPTALSDLINTKPYPRLGVIGLGEGGYATAIQLNQDLRRLEEFYHGVGYPLARASVEVARSAAALDDAGLLGLQTAVPSPTDGNDELYVRFRIDEGHQELVGSIEVAFDGKHQLSEAEVRKVLRLKVGQPYTRAAYENDKARLVTLYTSRGHPYPKIDPEVKQDQTHHAAVIWKIVDEGPLVRFGEILLRGNFVTSERVIRRNLPFKPGDLYNRNLLLEAEQNLLQRQLFSFVRVVPNPGENAQYTREADEEHWTLERNPVPILIELSERYDNRGEVSAAFGVSTDNVVYGTASYIWPNLFGSGTAIEVRGELGVRIQSLLAQFSDPQIFGRSWRLDLRAFWRNELTYSLGPVTTYGGNVEITRFVANSDAEGRRLPPTLKFFSRLEFTISQNLVPLYRSEGTTDFTQVGDQTQQIKLTAGVVWDKRLGFNAPKLRLFGQAVPTDPLMPVSGFLLLAQVTGSLCCTFLTDAGGSYLTATLQGIELRPFGPILREEDGWPYGMKRFNLKANVQFNYGLPLFHSALPEVEQFFAGGDFSTRGYDTDALKAEVVQVPISPLTGSPAFYIKPEGGNIRLVTQLDWEFAITPKILGWPWVGAVFVDSGAVFNSFSTVTWNDFRFSVGLSLLRILTRFGSLSLEYAYPVTLPGQEPLPQSRVWEQEPWYGHWPGRIHFIWGMPISR